MTHSRLPGFWVPFLSFMKFLLTFLTLILTLSIAASAGAEEKNILVFGNSFSIGSFDHLPEIAAALGDEADVVALRGPFLEAIGRELGDEPLISVEQAEQLGHGESNAEGFVPLQSNTKKRVRVVETLKSRDWDFVAFQSGSSSANRIDNEESTAEFMQLQNYIHQYAPGAEVLLYMTTQYRNDGLLYGTDVKVPLLFRESRGVSRDVPYTEDKQFFDAYLAHTRLAEKLGIRIIPGGVVFQNVRYDEGWPYSQFPKPGFDYAGTTGEVVPQEKSLRYGMKYLGVEKGHPAGFKWWVDSHPHTLGDYLQGLVYYETLFGKSAVGCSYYPEVLSAEEALLLQKIAHETGQGRMPPLRLFSPEDIARYNEVLAANPNSVVESVEADEEYNRMTAEIWKKYGKQRVKK